MLEGSYLLILPRIKVLILLLLKIGTPSRPATSTSFEYEAEGGESARNPREGGVEWSAVYPLYISISYLLFSLPSFTEVAT